MPIDFSDISEYIEDEFFTDRCIIRREQGEEGTVDSRWDEATGRYKPTRANRLEVWRGICMVYTKNVAGPETTEGGGSVMRQQFYLSLPKWADVDDVNPEDIVLITESADPSLRGEEFYVDAMDQGTVMVTREVAINKKKNRVN